MHKGDLHAFYGSHITDHASRIPLPGLSPSTRASTRFLSTVLPSIMVTIIDYGIGNLRSIEKAFQRVGAEVLRTDDPQALREAERLVLPGVGAFGACINEIRRRNLEGPIHEAVAAGTPFLGVCVGLQLLFEAGHEKGMHEGLGLLPGRVVHFHDASDGWPDDLVVPHMGWNTIEPTRAHPLLDGTGEAAYVYFVHSYHAVAEDPGDVLAATTYGHDFPAVVQRENVFGVQFHPEKSQAAGLRILENFATLPVQTAAA
jgi:glutamine amidotransferase